MILRLQLLQSLLPELASQFDGRPAGPQQWHPEVGQALHMILALEWAAAGIRVNCVAPGTILSTGIQTYPPAVQALTVKGARGIPASRLGTESEISAAIAFLLSPAAGYITGETLKIDGGSQFQKGRFIAFEPHDKSAPFHAFHLRADFSGTPFEGM